jgi:tetratricopeptide (TPR) repeat protein
VECPTCHERVVPDDGYCPSCGSPIEVSADGAVAPQVVGAVGVACPVCGTQNKAGEEYCTNCGAPLAVVTWAVGAGPSAGVGAASGAVKCSVCGSDIPANEEYCPTCGAPRSASTALPSPDGKGNGAQQAQTICPNCGAPLRPGAKFCRECGERFTTLPTEKGAPSEPRGLQVGQILAGRYKLVSVIGGGGMGMVFKAFDLNLKTRQEPEGRPAAVKAILNTDDPELLAQAVDEREMLIRLDHPHIVRIFDIVEERGLPYIVMAYVKGTSWKELYDQNGGPLPESEALRLVLGIRGAFEYLHGRTPPVVYRDFKPGNVIQVDDGNGRVRQTLIDLGTAVEYFPGQKREAWGTVGFAPPEIGGICEQPPTMDLFGIVSTLAALLGVDVNHQGIGAPPRAEWPVSAEIYDLVVRGRDPDPRVRFQSVGELFDQLEGIERFIKGQERARLAGKGSLGGRATSPLTGTLVPVQSTIITGRLTSSIQGATGRISALPALSTSDPAGQMLQGARDLMSAGRYAEALQQIDAALKTHPASIDGFLLRAAALNNMGHTDQARESLAQADRLSTPATRWRTLLVQAQAAESTDDYKRAEMMYGDLVKLVPGEVLPKQALADIYRQTGRYQKAAEMYGRVVAADPANADAVLGWADSLVALNQTNEAIGVLDAVNENALRFVDAQLQLIRLYLQRIDAYLEKQWRSLKGLGQNNPDLQALWGDLALAGRAIAGLNDRTESTQYYRLQADWWYVAYRLARAGKLPPNMEWPDKRAHKADNAGEIGEACRMAYRRYLQRAPEASDREDVLARIYFDVEEWQ